MSEQRWCRAGCYWVGLIGITLSILFWLIKWSNGLDPTFQFHGGLLIGCVTLIIPALLIPRGWDE
jgi:hypothetical protein